MKNRMPNELCLVFESSQPKNHHFTDSKKKAVKYLKSPGLKSIVDICLEFSDLQGFKEQLQENDYQKMKKRQGKKPNNIEMNNDSICNMSKSNEYGLHLAYSQNTESTGVKTEKVENIIEFLPFSQKNTIKHTNMLRKDFPLEAMLVKFNSSREFFSHLSIKNEGGK